MPPGLQRRERAASSSSACSAVSSATSPGCLRQRASGRRRSAPRPVHGRVEQDAVERARLRSARTAVPSPLDDLGRRRRTTASAVAHESARAGTSSLATRRRAAERRLGGEQRRLAARAGAQVEPALPRDDRPGAAERERGELRALVLHAGAPARDRGQFGRVAAAETRARSARRGRARRQLRDGRASPGKRDQAHPRRGVVGGQERLELVVAALGGERVRGRRARPRPDASTRRRAGRRRRRRPASAALAPLVGRRSRVIVRSTPLTKPVAEPRPDRSRRARPTRRPPRAAATRVDSSW